MPSDTRVGNSDVRSYLTVIRRRKVIIALATIVSVVVTVGVSLRQAPVYRAVATVVLHNQSIQGLLGQLAGPTTTLDAATEARLVNSPGVRAVVKQKLGDTPTVKVTEVGTADVLSIAAESPRPARAARVANVYANAFIETQSQQATADLTSAEQVVQQRIDDLQNQLNLLPATNAPATANQQAERTALSQELALLSSQLDQLKVDASFDTGNVQLVQAATPPQGPIRPTPVRTGLIGAGVGLTLGIGLAFLFEFLDESIKTLEDLERLGDDLPVLAAIPPSRGRESGLTSIESTHSQQAEAFRGLRAILEHAAAGRGGPCKIIAIASPGPEEGKSTLTANLGVAMARAGQRVVLVSGDLRHPRLHEILGLDNDIGMTSVLPGKVPLSAAVVEVPGEAGLSLLASGPVPSNPAELLASPRFGEVLRVIAAATDVVLLDCAPVLPVADTAILMDQVDMCVLCVMARKTTRRQFKHAMRILRQVDAPLCGTVLNGAGLTDEYGYGYRYSHYSYSSSSPDEESPKTPQHKASSRPDNEPDNEAEKVGR